MLYRGAVPTLIPPTTVQGRKNNVMRFDISPYATMEFYLSFALNREQLGSLLLKCVEAFQQLQRAYMDSRNLVLDLDKVYVLLNDGSVHFIYLPLTARSKEVSLANFFRGVLNKVARGTYELSEFVTACAAWLDRPVNFTLDEFSAFIQGRMYQVEPVRTDAGAPRERDMSWAYQQIPQAAGHIAAEPEVSGGMGGTPQSNTVLLSGGGGGTVLLDAPPEEEKATFCLLRDKTGERIALGVFPFVVGAELGKVSYCVRDNGAVSRRHAVFTLQDGGCVVTDQSSTNKTYVNDVMLPPLVPHRLKNGDHIRLANEPFTFLEGDA